MTCSLCGAQLVGQGFTRSKAVPGAVYCADFRACMRRRNARKEATTSS